jgi:uncharacterized cupredoxin-like copper-binding protein
MRRPRSSNLLVAAVLTIALALAALTVGGGHNTVAQNASPMPSCPAATPLVASPVSGSPVAVSPAATMTGSPEAATPTASGCEVTIDLTDSNFMPTTITIPANAEVHFILHNVGTKAHNFSVPIIHVSANVDPGQTKEVTIAVVPGDYQFVSTINGATEPGFFGTIHAA